MSSSEERTAGIGAYDALLLTSLLWFLAKFLRYAFPPLFDALAGEYGVSEAALGGAFTAFMIVYAGMQFPSGILGDRLGGVRVVTAGALVAVVGAVLVAAGDRLAPALAALPGVDPFWLVVLAMVVVGLGTGAHKTVAIGLLSRIYPSRSGRVMGVHDTFGTFGGVVAPAAVALALGAPAVGWRAVFVAGAVIGAVLAVAFALRVPRRLAEAGDRESAGVDGGDGDAADRPPLAAYATPFREPRFAAFVLVTLCFGFAYNGLVAFLPLYLSRAAGVSDPVASLLYGLLFAVTLVQLATGELSDRVGRLPVIAGTIGLATLALAALVAVPAIGPTWQGVPLGTAAVVATLGLGAHGFRPVRAAHLDALLPSELAGGGLGAVRTGLMGAGAVAPASIGVLVEATGYRPGFALLAILLALAVAIVAGLWATADADSR